MTAAIWNLATLAESAQSSNSRELTISRPRASSLNSEFYEASAHTTVYPWKEPKTAAANIEDHVAFWKGVAVES